MDVKEAIEKRKSIRKYLDKEISQEIIDELIEVARLAPSAYNAQPWKFVILKDKKAIEELKERKVFVQDFVYNAPLIIICCGTPLAYPEKSRDKFDFKDLTNGDVSIACQNIVMQATELGLGSCYVGLIDRDVLKEYFGIGDEYIMPFVISFGYPDENGRERVRKERDKIIL